MHCHRRWSYPFQRLSVFCFLFFNVFIVWYKCYNQWDQPGYFCGGSGKYFGQNQIISVCRPIKKIWGCCTDKAKSVTVFHRRKPADVKAGKTLALPKHTLTRILVPAIYWWFTCICYFILHFWTKCSHWIISLNILLGYACLPGSSGQWYKWPDWHFMERSWCPKRYITCQSNSYLTFAAISIDRKIRFLG